jgi:hypothetical protein
MDPPLAVLGPGAWILGLSLLLLVVGIRARKHPPF